MKTNKKKKKRKKECHGENKIPECFRTPTQKPTSNTIIYSGRAPQQKHNKITMQILLINLFFISKCQQNIFP